MVGADRVAANGDVANKIGTYTIAVLARENRVPFYVAAPLSTLDLALADGQSIPIEMRDPAEVRVVQGVEILPPEVQTENPAFDITPARFLSAIVTERGLVEPPFEDGLRNIGQIASGVAE
jgi:methylthioribose-1-phosphate isomerase